MKPTCFGTDESVDKDAGIPEAQMFQILLWILAFLNLSVGQALFHNFLRTLLGSKNYAISQGDRKGKEKKTGLKKILICQLYFMYLYVDMDSDPNL